MWTLTLREEQFNESLNINIHKTQEEVYHLVVIQDVSLTEGGLEAPCLIVFMF